MKKFFENLWEQYKKRSHARKIAEMNRHINSVVVIKNDINDPQNKIYIFVEGVPVMRLEALNKETERFFANIKEMYRNKLVELPINR